MSGGDEEDSLIGVILEGRFRIERKVGEGGMGRVYVADEVRLRRRCALKVLLPEMATNPEYVERFFREAQAIAQIQHDNVVDIHHLGEDQEHGVVFFAMELLVGEDLETRLEDRARRPVSWRQLCAWFLQVASAMAAVHAAGMIHRDLKPSNIFLARAPSGREQAKLLDFGIAKNVSYTAPGPILTDAKTEMQSALTTTGQAIGTPYYMSPEQILAQPIDYRTDIYSLGVTMYEALTGQPPFLGEPMQVAMQHCNVDPPPITSVNPAVEIPPALAALVMSMLAKEPVARPQTMEAIEASLAALIPGSSSGEARRKPSPSMSPTLQFRAPNIVRAAPAPAPAPARGLPWLVPMLIALGAVAIVVIGLVLTSEGDDPGPEPTTATAESVEADAIATTATTTTTTTASAEAPTMTSTSTAIDAASTTTPATTTTPGDAPPAPTTDAEPAATTTTPEKTGGTKVVRDPLKQLTRLAAACRREHKAGREPKITIDYGIGSDGTVTRAVPSTKDPLGECLAAAVKKTTFPPGLRLGQKIEL